ncbi:receptor-type tyrosine-protein phosphatase kappa [Plakobranchus ocellatus]|uniref:protein-tyrosine-phosphatase n=1 Tax=Plakobranchus ocellatus TaxID=259542 RepID=A0AAV3WRV1_9GAST|nr:receptor-type tyrosine-protein phosphatase kappa [Plakobranchus ocellatus]
MATDLNLPGIPSKYFIFRLIVCFILFQRCSANICYTKNELNAKSECKYHCHCQDDAACNRTTGRCPSKCAAGWFGPGCQYVSLPFSPESNSSGLYWLTDETDDTCNIGGIQSVSVNLKTPQILTWVRIVVDNDVNLGDIQLLYKKEDETQQRCLTNRVSRVDNTTVDIFCPTSDIVKGVILSGRGVKSLCSLYISGGRNVALKQRTQQSSTYLKSDTLWLSSNAVDGSVYSDVELKDIALTCTHTKESEFGQWNLTFERPVELYKMVLNNRWQSCCRVRLKGFTLRTLNRKKKSVFDYTDQEKNVQSDYIIIHKQSAEKSVKFIEITKGSDSEILTLCEVFAYGEVKCLPKRFGRECERVCNCADQTEACFVSTGGCPSGCAAGYTGEDCYTRCPKGRFGFICNSTCSVHCDGADNACDPISGSCDRGCVPGYQPPLCTKVIENSHQDGIIIGAIVGVTLGLIIIVTILFIYLFRCHSTSGPSLKIGRQGSQQDEGSRLELQNRPTSSGWRKLSRTPRLSVRTILEEESPDSVYTNMLPGNTAVPIKDLRSFLHQHTTDSFLINQFESIPMANSYAKEHGTASHNVKKNRYKNIVPYDHCRVILCTDAQKKHNDYINASFIKSFDNTQKYIAAQAPTDQTSNDFVRMLWEKRIDRVVMLTNVVEQRKIKCAVYWPQDVDKVFEEITVKLISLRVYAEYTIRHLQLTKNGENHRTLTQFHFTAWPDNSVPDSPWGLVDFQQRVMTAPGDGPLLVHCSAGVGRTGTFIALCNLLEEAEALDKMDFLSTLWALRQDRMSMIQTDEQYIFLHKTALAAHLIAGTSFRQNDIASKFMDLKIEGTDAKKGAGFGTYIQEFNAVTEATIDETCHQGMCPEEAEDVYQNSRAAVNKEKNRVKNILPKDAYRPVLACEIKSLSKYINAAFVPNFTKDRHDILTQLPLPSTVTDFWRLVTQFQVGLVVAFEADSKNADETVGAFLPENDEEPLKSELFEIQARLERETSLWQELSVTVFKKRRSLLAGDCEHRVLCLLCKNADTDPDNMLQLQRKIKSCRPVKPARTLYMCRNGADFCGLVCVQSILLDRLEVDHCLAVPYVVGAIKAIRPQVIPTEDQYRCLYLVLKRQHESTANSTHGAEGDRNSNNAVEASPGEDPDNVYCNVGAVGK